MTRKRIKIDACLLFEFEPKSVNDALDNEYWIQEINEGIEQMEKNKTWSLVPRLKDKNVIGTKWVFRNRLNEKGEVARKKDRLV